MKLKSELYKNQQLKLVDTIIKILELDDKHQITLYELENNEDKINKIIALIPELRKYFAFGKVRSLEYPDQAKRPWLSIIRQITKLKYKMIRKDHRIYNSDGIIRTIIYTFELK